MSRSRLLVVAVSAVDVDPRSSEGEGELDLVFHDSRVEPPEDPHYDAADPASRSVSVFFLVSLFAGIQIGSVWIGGHTSTPREPKQQRLLSRAKENLTLRMKWWRNANSRCGGRLLSVRLWRKPATICRSGSDLVVAVRGASVAARNLPLARLFTGGSAGPNSGRSGSSVCPTDCRCPAIDLLSAILAFFCECREGPGQVRFSEPPSTSRKTRWGRQQVSSASEPADSPRQPSATP